MHVYMFFFVLFIYLFFASLFSKERKKEGVKLDREGGKEDLEEEGGETEIRIYCMEKHISSKNSQCMKLFS